MTLTPGPNYGDGVKLESFKRASGTSGPMIERDPVGRPAAAPLVPVTPVVSAPPSGVVPEPHLALMKDYARAIRSYEQWQPLANAADAGPWVRRYAEVARQQVEQAALALKQNTPDFIG